VESLIKKGNKMIFYKTYYWVPHEGEFDISYFMDKNKAMDYCDHLNKQRDDDFYIVSEIETED